MNHINAKDVESLFTPKEIVDIIYKGIVSYSEGKYNIPDRMHINHEGSTTLIMPAFGPKYNCTKIVAVYPENQSKNIPVINGLIVLNDSDTGVPLTSIDAPMITALRTAAVGSIGMGIIWQKKSLKLGVIGLGVQGLWQTIFALSTKEVSVVYCTTRNRKKFLLYKSRVEEKFPDIKIIYCMTAEEVVEKANVIIACTTSKSPIFSKESLNISEKRFISVGSFKKTMQELPEHVYTQADALIIDAKSAENEVGDVIRTKENNWISSSHIYTLADVLSRKVNISNHNNLVFKSVGMAAFDLSLASAIYEKLCKVKN